MTVSTLNILASSIGLLGAIFIAVSITRFIKSVRTAITAHELFIETLTSGGDITQIAGTDIHVMKGAKKAGKLTNIGIILLVIAFLLQLLQFLPATWTFWIIR